MKTILSRPQVEFMHSQIIEIDKLLIPGRYDAQQVLQRTRSLILVVKSTLETAMMEEDIKGYLFFNFDN